MSDFLTNLAARAIAKPTLRPRTRSRFEPATEEPDAAQPRVAQTILSVPRVPVPEEERETAQTGLSVPHTKEDARVEHVVVERVVPGEAERSAETIVQREPGRVIERVVHEPPERITETRVQREAPRIIETSIAAEPERIVERATVHDDTTPQPPPRPHRFEQQPPRVERHETTRIRSHETTLHDERITNRMLDRHERLASRVTRTRELAVPTAATTPAPEPVVHVSIGRVEVRAVQQASAPARTSARRPPMSIDEYAARQERKGRR